MPNRRRCFPDISEDEELDSDLDLDESEEMDVSLDDEEIVVEEAKSTTSDSHLDLSSLEDELGLDESEMVQAPKIEAIKDVESEDELERELASFGDNIENQNLPKAEETEDLVLDESMMVKDIDADAVLEEESDTASEEDIPHFMKSTDVEEESSEVLEISDIDQSDDFDLSEEVF